MINGKHLTTSRQKVRKTHTRQSSCGELTRQQASRSGRHLSEVAAARDPSVAMTSVGSRLHNLLEPNNFNFPKMKHFGRQSSLTKKVCKVLLFIGAQCKASFDPGEFRELNTTELHIYGKNEAKKEKCRIAIHVPRIIPQVRCTVPRPCVEH